MTASGVRGSFRRQGGPPGAQYEGGGRSRFSVWAPHHERIQVRLVDTDRAPVALEPDGEGGHAAVIEGVPPGSLYVLRLPGGREVPDPASRRQPHGVHGPSAVVDPDFAWTVPAFPALGLADLVLYEIHVGTFTPEGTFDAIVPRLGALRDLGVTAIELMPVSPFPGERNWGYDGVFPFAVQESYGGPDGLRRLVDACHGAGMGVLLDVVYNHLGPEGGHLADLGPCFTDRYTTPWGPALDLDGPASAAVRAFFIESALWQMTSLHADGFRVDAIHAIQDHSSPPFLLEFTETLHARAREERRSVLLIAESDMNDPRVIHPASEGGLGFDAQWSEDFHHAAHAFLTGERAGYYQDFGSLEMVARALETPHVYEGQFSSWRGSRRGGPAAGLPAERFVVYTQNHDQVGNRARGDRLAASLGLRTQRLLAALLILSPWIPLLFMGQEYGETAPFPFFTSHQEEDLADRVRRGRRRELEGAGWDVREMPDPQDPATFDSAKLHWSRSGHSPFRELRDLHRELLRLRREIAPLRAGLVDGQPVSLPGPAEVLTLHRRGEGGATFAAFFFGAEREGAVVEVPAGAWRKLLDTEDERWGGQGSPVPAQIGTGDARRLRLAARSCVVLAREEESGA